MSDESTDTDATATDAEGTPTEQPTEPDTDWKAEAEKYKALARKHENRAKSNADAAKRLSELEQQRANPDAESDPDAIRKQVKAEAAAEILRERALDKAVVKAAGKLADPEDARIYLAANVEDFLDGDTLDQDAIAVAVDELLKARPYLAAQGGSRFTGGADGGARGARKPSQLSSEDLKGMSPQDVMKARAEGRLNDLMGIPT